MSRLVLRLLLALTLVCNGLLAPWAMAGMAGSAATIHGRHHGQDAAAGADAADLAHHRHPGDALGPLPADGGTPDDTDGAGSCCEDASCHCGCVLPPALPVVSALVLAHRLDASPANAVEAWSGIRRASPPLRPPAT